MSRPLESEHPWDDELDDDDGPFHDGDDDDDDDDLTIPCSSCQRAIYEDAERCPYCGAYLSREDSPAARKPWWIMLGIVACLYVVYRSIIWW